MTPPINADAGIVSTQAHTICRATPHRTAETRLTEPTPMIAPVMVCVVLTDAESGGDVDGEGSSGFGGEPAERLQLRDLASHRLDDAPAARERAQTDRGVRRAGSPRTGS